MLSLLKNDEILLLCLDDGNREHGYTKQDISLTQTIAHLMALILARAQRQKELTEARANELVLREANHRMEEFLSIICHELKTPLTVMRGSIQLAERKVKRLFAADVLHPDEVRRFAPVQALLERTQNQITIQDHLVNDLLDTSRIQTNTLKLIMEACNFVSIVQEAVEDQRQVAPTRTIHLEKSLSVDNIFVFVLLFAYFNVPTDYQHRVLFWGILGALIMRGILIAVGAVLLEEFHWILYLFGAFLIITGLRMGLHKETEIHPEKNPLLKLVRRVFPVTKDYEGARFLVRRGGQLLVTPLFLVLLIVESTDLVFAVDSIPAVFAVTRDPFIVYTSNVFAILGLRSRYFVFANIIDKFYYLKVGLSVILTYVGVKMLLADIYPIPTFLSLAIIALVLSIAILASVIRARHMPAKPDQQKEELSSPTENVVHK